MSTGYQPTATEVKALRERTGLPIMDCKRALVETGGNADDAIDLLRKRGERVQGRKAGRETTQGRIECYLDPSGEAVAMVEMSCEQAPSAKNERFAALTQTLAELAARMDAEPTAENLLEEPDIDDPSGKAKDRLLEVVNLIRENMAVARVTRLKADGGVLGKYLHFNYQEAAIVRLEGDDATRELANDIATHIVAAKPIALRREDVPAEVVEKEREIAREQAAQTGKPANIVEKIAEGKLSTWFGERVLLEQGFVKDPKTKIRDLLKQTGGANVTGFERFKVGEEG